MGTLVELLQTIVRRFLRDDHVVNVRLLQTRGGDAQEASLLLELLYGVTARIAHAGSQPTHKLRDHVSEGSLVRHSTFDAFGHEFRFILRHVLGIPVSRAFAHGSNRTHATIGLE